MNRHTTPQRHDAPNILRGAFRPAMFVRCARAWAAFRAWRNRRLAMRELARMPDSLLRDIGIERWQIRDVVNGGVHTAIFRAPNTSPQKSGTIRADSGKKAA